MQEDREMRFVKTWAVAAGTAAVLGGAEGETHARHAGADDNPATHDVGDDNGGARNGGSDDKGGGDHASGGHGSDD